MDIKNNKIKEFLIDGKIGEAADFLKKIIEKNPDDCNSRFTLGQFYYSLNDFHKAEEQFHFCLDKNYSLKDTYYNLGILYKEQQKYEEALKYLNLVIKEDNKDVEAFNHIGECFFYLGYFSDAEKVLKASEELDPHFLLAKYNLAYLYYSFSDYKKALAKIKEVFEIDPKFENANIVYNKILNEVEFIKSKKNKNQVDKLRVGFVTIWFERGQSYVTKALRDVLKNDFDTFVLARMGGVNGERKQNREGKWHESEITYYPDYRIPPDVLKEWIYNNKLDVVVFNEEYDWNLVFSCKKFGIRTVTYMDYYKDEWESLLQLYDGILCSTLRSYEMIKDKSKAHYIGWGVDVDLFKPVRETEKKYTFFHNAGWAGINFRKMTPAVVLAFDALSKVNNDASLLIHSQAELEKYPAFMQDIVKSNKKIEFLCGTVQHPGYYHLGEIYVYPTKLEGLGLTLFEALSAGLPVITTDAAPMNEFVKHGYNGLLVNVAKTGKRYDNIAFPEAIININDLAYKMNFLSREKEIKKKMSGNARKFILQKCNWKKKKKDITELFDALFEEAQKEEEVLCENSLC